MHANFHFVEFAFIIQPNTKPDNREEHRLGVNGWHIQLIKMLFKHTKWLFTFFVFVWCGCVRLCVYVSCVGNTYVFHSFEFNSFLFIYIQWNGMIKVHFYHWMHLFVDHFNRLLELNVHSIAMQVEQRIIHRGRTEVKWATVNGYGHWNWVRAIKAGMQWTERVVLHYSNW